MKKFLSYAFLFLFIFLTIITPFEFIISSCFFDKKLTENHNERKSKLDGLWNKYSTKSLEKDFLNLNSYGISLKLAQRKNFSKQFKAEYLDQNLSDKVVDEKLELHKYEFGKHKWSEISSTITLDFSFFSKLESDQYIHIDSLSDKNIGKIFGLRNFANLHLIKAFSSQNQPQSTIDAIEKNRKLAMLLLNSGNVLLSMIGISILELEVSIIKKITLEQFKVLSIEGLNSLKRIFYFSIININLANEADKIKILSKILNESAIMCSALDEIMNEGTAIELGLYVKNKEKCTSRKHLETNLFIANGLKRCKIFKKKKTQFLQMVNHYSDPETHKLKWTSKYNPVYHIFKGYINCKEFHIQHKLQSSFSAQSKLFSEIYPLLK